MSRTTAIIGLLVVAVVLLDVALVTSDAALEWPRLAGVVFYSLIFGQAAVLAASACLLQCSLGVRVLWLVGGASFLAGVIEYSIFASRFDSMTTVVFQMLPVVIPSLVLRRRGYRLHDDGMAAAENQQTVKWTFSISDLLLMTCALAATCGTLRWAADRFGSFAATLSFICSATAAMTVLACWLTGNERRARLLQILFCVEFLIGLRSAVLSALSMACLSSATATALVFVLHSAGLQWVRTATFREELASDAFGSELYVRRRSPRPT